MNKKILLLGCWCLLASALGVAEENSISRASSSKETDLNLSNTSFPNEKIARQHSEQETSNKTPTPMLSPLKEHKKTTISILDALRSRHYEDVFLNDSSSEKLLDEYISNCPIPFSRIFTILLN